MVKKEMAAGAASMLEFPSFLGFQQASMTSKFWWPQIFKPEGKFRGKHVKRPSFSLNMACCSPHRKSSYETSKSPES